MLYSGRSVNKVFNQDFVIDKRFKIVKELGHGAYGIVCSARYDDGLEEESEGNFVAIKKITNIFSKKILCKRSLRELKLLQFFRGHKNITCLYDLDIVPNPITGAFNEIYLYEELMECDMHQIIRLGQPLTDSHYQLFIYQVLCGLKYIHSADVLHRDLKPGNLLVNADCELKICDFGLARGFLEDVEQNAGFMTEYVATRWYRAPEIMLSFSNYTKAIDIWSVGCILGELLGGKPLFRGKDYVDQLNQILMILGTPKEATLTKIGSVRAQNYVRLLPIMRRVPYLELFPGANPLALDLLEKMLTLDPFERITVNDALNHPYLAIWHDLQDEPECKMKFDFSTFETVDDIELMKKLIIEEVQTFRDFVRKPIHEQQQIQLQMQREQENHQQQLHEQQQHHQQQQQQKLHEQQQFQEQQHHQQQQQHQQPRQQEQMHHQQLQQLHLHDPDMTIKDNFGQFPEIFSSAGYSGISNGGVLTNPEQLHNENELLYYQQIPKPQELDEFSFMGQKSDNPEHFRLEEELGFGLDGVPSLNQ
ncbi:CIC11C00000003314 [Sungouiella intermedia]|uniref:Mitogen-activated protein kinase n=1 Tax=Sungouiella intermedia TaxID=45354 RepID=A0A1L0BYZ5_9ASCO|nr:CIC11C00000003314 [[Candida] intermedia]